MKLLMQIIVLKVSNYMCELIEEYISVIYDTYLSHVAEHNDYETFGHAMAIVLPQFMHVAKYLSNKYKEITLEGAYKGEYTE